MALQGADETLSRLSDRLSGYRDQWVTEVDKTAARLRMFERELLQEDEVSVTGQTLLEQSARSATAHADAPAQHKCIHTNVSKVGKAVERDLCAQPGQLCKGEKSLERDPEARRLAATLIVDHLMTDGHPQVAELLVQEAGITGRLDEYISRKDEVETIMCALRARQVQPALDYLREQAPEETELRFDLHRQQVIALAGKGRRLEAIEEARKAAPLGTAADTAQMMGACLAGKSDPRYAHLYSELLWAPLEARVAKVLSQTDSHLSEILETGARAVPSLLNLRNMMAHRHENLLTADELPTEIPIARHVHSTFACPIMKQLATESNPPMRLRCGHVITKDALNKLAQFPNHFRPIKCPYCPEESALSDARRVFF